MFRSSAFVKLGQNNRFNTFYNSTHVKSCENLFTNIADLKPYNHGFRKSLFRVYRTWGNFGGRKFWRIISDEANGEENFGESAGRSSVISLYL